VHRLLEFIILLYRTGNHPFSSILEEKKFVGDHSRRYSS